MKAPFSWINEYVKIDDITPKQYAHAMTMSGSKVESIETQGENIIGVVTGKILKIERHPNADKLVVCQVDIGDEVLQIITGADNMKEGDFVAVATDGSTLPGGKIKKGKLRGVESCGMMCSEDELGLQQERAEGIMVWQTETPLGVDIKSYLGLNETIVEFEITSNRPDCLSIIGLARETAATFAREFAVKTPVVSEKNDNIENYIKVRVENEKLCPRYSCRAVKNIKIEHSPEWMQKRLEGCGIRPINNIVDITNYVMLEYGQPMHAFDLRMIGGKEIIVRTATEGEPMKTLDEQEHLLDGNMLVIADCSKPIAIAGVMGGENSEIQNDTTTVIFESANFNGESVRSAAKKLGMRTESSARFEKGLDAHNTVAAVNRACELICELGAGEVVDGMIDVCAPFEPERKIPLNVEKINSFLGTNIEKEFIISSLESLGFTVENNLIAVPSFRGDVEGEADIAEEVARIYGYDKIPSSLNTGETTLGGKNDKQSAEDLVKTTLTSLGFYEIITYSLINPKMFDKMRIEKMGYIELLNPLGKELSILRTQALGSALEVLSTNYNRRVDGASLFELATTYQKGGDDGLAIEKQQVIIAMYGNEVDFYDIKGATEQLFDAFGIANYKTQQHADPVFHDGQTAIISVKNQQAAVLGRIHPTVQKNFEIGADCYAAVIDFDMLLKFKDLDIKFKHLPKYPAVTRDIAITVSNEISVGQIEEVFNKFKSGIVEKYNLFDVYQGEQIEKGKKSVAYALTLRSADKTLKDEEVNKVLDAILKELKRKFSAEQRL
ncbi:MAG: phenylalanine--tRNA ligase subunit beta [Firmicutes bacterium]|nr:phenylalanine--tRNA ligase subunit beta [Bacillota bacterium]